MLSDRPNSFDLLRRIVNTAFDRSSSFSRVSGI